MDAFGAFISAAKRASIGRKDMSEKIHPVPADFAKRAFVDHAKYLDMYKRSVVDPDGFWGEQAKRLDWIKPFTRVKNTSFKLPNVSIKWFEDGDAQRLGQLPRPPSRQARRPDRHHLGGRRPGTRPQDHLSRAASRGLPLRQRAEGLGVQQGRPRHHLHADDPRGGGRRCSPAPGSARIHSVVFGGFSPEFARRPDRGLRHPRRHHRRRGAARRQASCR